MKSTLRKLFSIVLSLLLIVSTVCSTALISVAAGDFTIENGVLTKYTGTAANVIIPDGVTSIRYSVFENCTSLTSVTIPESMTTIGCYAFRGCTSLTGIIIPSNVSLIRLCQPK